MIREGRKEKMTVTYSVKEYPLERSGIALHLSRTIAERMEQEREILLVHGVTYSSQEFDIDYQDYSLVRKLAGEGYGVWLLDIAGFGRSGRITDGFLPDSDYAAEDICAAVTRICEITGKDRIDVLGWSWGSVTAGRFAGNHPEHLDRLVLYAPILCGIGKSEVTEPFHHNTWEHAADDFQKDESGEPDETIAEKAVVDCWCSSCWRYDGDSSPNGGRRDLCQDRSVRLIDLSKITVPVLVICGDRDPYLDYDLVSDCLNELPEGSVLEMIPGGSHMVFIEKPYYHDFRERLLRFLER